MFTRTLLEINRFSSRIRIAGFISLNPGIFLGNEENPRFSWSKPLKPA